MTGPVNESEGINGIFKTFRLFYLSTIGNSPRLSLPLTGNMNFTKNRSLGWVYSFRSQKMIGLTSFTFDSHMLCNICINMFLGRI